MNAPIEHHHHLPWHSFRHFLENQFGHQLYRIPIDLNSGCPHRAVDGSGGCTYCPENGARAVQTSSATSLESQIGSAIEFAKRRYGAKHFIAYFQAFTPTLLPSAQQAKIYGEVLKHYPFEVISIGTRPDCISEATLDTLTDLKKRADVWVELGIQSCHDRTLLRLHRGHTWQQSCAAVKKLHERDIFSVAHIMANLPGETRDDAIETARQTGMLPFRGIKFHNLHIIKETELGRQYQSNPFELWDEFTYCDMLMQMLRWIPSSWPIMRLCTDTPDEQLIAPKWSMTKGEFISLLETQMKFQDVRQGDALAKQPRRDRSTQRFTPVKTADHTITFRSPEWEEHYHSPDGAYEEALTKYIAPSQLDGRLSQSHIALLDICFGLGYNTLGAIETAEQIKQGHLNIHALEMDRRVVQQAALSIQQPPHTHLNWRQILSDLVANGHVRGHYFDITMHWGDARHTAKQIQDASIDIVFLDPFSTQKNSELWTLDFIQLVQKKMTRHAALFTYSTATPVRSAFLQAGYYVGDSPQAGRQRGGTIAATDESWIKYPVSQMDIKKIAHPTRGQPYRDPNLCATNSTIHRIRQEEIKRIKDQQ